MEGDIYLTPLGSVLPSSTSGSAKTKQRNALPNVFFITGRSPHRLHGACLVNIAYSIGLASHFVQLGGVCMLENPLTITPEFQQTRSNGLFKVAQELEVRARREPTVPGGSLNMHFSGYAGTSWRCWDFSPEKAVQGPVPQQLLQVDSKIFKAMGVALVQVDSLRDILPTFDGEVLAPPTTTQPNMTTHKSSSNQQP